MVPTLAQIKASTVDRRLWLSGGLLLAITLTFWLGSRYPALDEKALMGEETQLAALGFETLLAPDESAPLWEQVAVNAVNWLYTNRQGMTFGILLAAALLTLLSLVSTPVFKSRLANSFVGVLVGSPLGVCVNCAAPIAYGMAGAGVRTETTLAMMLSSPTLNIVVLTMLFALFPPYVAVIKIGLTLAVLLVGIPLVTRLVPLPENASLGDRPTPLPFGINAPDAPLLPETTRGDGAGRWLDAIRWTAVAYGRHLWFIIRFTVPLMVLAGVLGALAVTLLPLDEVATLLPTQGKLLLIAAFAALTLFGLFLPVPMAFDVIVAAILLQAGVPVMYVAVLLFTLGIFSIYAFGIIWQAVGRATALLLFLGLAATGVTAGVLGLEGSQWAEARERQLFLATFSAAAVDGPRHLWHEPATVAKPLAALRPALEETTVEFEPFDAPLPDGVAVTFAAHTPSVESDGPHRFTRFIGDEIGLDPPYNYWVGKAVEPFSTFRAIAAADVHGDGWPDILVASERGVHLFANLEGQGFARLAIDIPQLNDAFIGNATLVDLNDDGLPDLFASVYRGGAYVVYNEDGAFLARNLQMLPNAPEAIMAGAAAFGDVDADGDVDIVLGNWSLGAGTQGSYPSSQDGLLLQDEGTFSLTLLSARPGETLSMLLTDFTGDGALDLIVGNDFASTDIYYVGDGRGGFTPLTSDDGLIPRTTSTTMSIHSADIDNDLQPELFLAQASLDRESVSLLRDGDPALCDPLDGSRHAALCRQWWSAASEIAATWSPRDPDACRRLAAAGFRLDCLAYHLRQYTRTPAGECAMLPESWDWFRFGCLQRLEPFSEPTAAELAVEIPEQGRENVLLFSTADGSYVDRSAALGIQHTEWSWNAKFADVDNDGWQDLYVANGFFRREVREPNLFYYNRGGEHFEEASAAAGLDLHFATSAYTYVDYDRDGDLDIIAVPVVGPLFVYRNDGATGHSVSVSLVDERGNTAGLGSVVTIGYGDGSQQMRELQAGGGFVSYDPPVAHFGLGDQTAVDRLTIRWSTGETTTLIGPFPANRHYIIHRQP